LGRRLCDEDPEQTVGKRKLMGQLYSAPVDGWMDGLERRVILSFELGAEAKTK